MILNYNNMKTNKYFFTALGFLTGLVLGISIIGSLAFTYGPGSSASGSSIVPITATDAHLYFGKYLSGAVSLNQVIKGFTIDKSQLEAMNSIAKENADLTGFRIYMGKDNTSRKIGIVVGVDAAGNDAVKNTIFSTDAPKLSPCPPICDISSPIMVDK
jgi:hypothetical protein